MGKGTGYSAVRYRATWCESWVNNHIDDWVRFYTKNTLEPRLWSAGQVESRGQDAQRERPLRQAAETRMSAHLEARAIAQIAYVTIAAQNFVPSRPTTSRWIPDAPTHQLLSTAPYQSNVAHSHL